MIKRIFFLSLFLIVSLASQAITISWNNASGDNLWSNPANWDLSTIPTANFDVFIPPSMGSSICDISFLTVQSVTISTGSRVSVEAGNRLIIETTNGISNTGLDIDIDAEFNNFGIVGIKFATFKGISNQGNLRNEGLIDLDFLQEIGIHNSGTFHNRSSGRLQFDEIGTIGILESETFINEGSIRFLSGGTGDGIHINGNLENEDQGSISFEGQNPGQIELFGTGSSLLNDGNINFDSGTTPDFCMMVTRGIVVNRGVLSFSGGLLGAIHLSLNGRFTNGGLCTIRGVNPLNSVGILCTENGALTNSEGRVLDISEVRTGVHLEGSSSRMNNEGSCLFLQTNNGVSCSGQMLNEASGEISFEEGEVGIGVATSGIVENDGTLTFENINRADIYNKGDFTNQACGTINGDQAIGNLNGMFANYGWLLYPNDGQNHQNYGPLMINHGIILDNYRRFDNVLENHKVRVLPFVNPRPNRTLKNVWDIENIDNLVNSNVTALPGGGTTVGKLNLSSNYFLPNVNIYQVSGKVYVTISDKLNRCSKIIEVRLEHIKSAFGNTLEEEFIFLPSTPNGTLKSSKIYPNPSTGIVNLKIPFELSGPINLRLMDHTGRLVWQETRSAKDGNVLDFSNETHTGIYLLQILQNGELIDQQKLVLQRN